METKKSAVVNIQENVRNYNTQHGTMYVHEIEFMNGDKGYYSSKSPKCEKFSVMKEANYTIDTKINGKYTNYIIKPAQDPETANIGAKKDHQPKNEGLIVAQAVYKAVMCSLQQSQYHTDQKTIEALCEHGFKWCMGKSTIKQS